MANKMKATEELLKELGVTERATIEFSMWQPWNDDGEHDTDPQGFVGTLKGYKISEKKQSGGDVNEFDIFLFDDCKPVPPKGASGFAVSSGFMLDNLKYVIPGTKVAIVYEGSDKNVHGGATRKIAWSFLNKKDKETNVAKEALPAANIDQYRMLSANGTSA